MTQPEENRWAPYIMHFAFWYFCTHCRMNTICLKIYNTTLKSETDLIDREGQGLKSPRFTSLKAAMTNCCQLPKACTATRAHNPQNSHMWLRTIPAVQSWISNWAQEKGKHQHNHTPVTHILHSLSGFSKESPRQLYFTELKI